ncbi:MAG: hypothetical protein H6833_07395 [Planctomycetes bacterium]|nr:hypothetical protein [Planctomycetota bacterium]
MTALHPKLFAFVLITGPALAQDPANDITFAEHVAPIIWANCSSCHRPGQAGPFSLLTYRDVAKRGRMIVDVTRDRYMPPWHPAPGHGVFRDALHLSQGEIDTLAAWVDQGMPEGDLERTSSPPVFASGWSLGEPDLVVEMPNAFPVPAGGPDIYRNFSIPIALEEARWITAIEVLPSARSVLHHVLFEVDERQRGRRLDGRDGKPGYGGTNSAFDAGSVSTSGLGGWAVGGQARHLPLGLARELPAGADLILHSHFHPAGKEEQERTKLGLYFAKERPERSMVGLQLPPMFGIAAGLVIPPGEANFILSDEYVLPVDALAVTVGGHAHYLCKEMQIHVTRPGEERTSIFWIQEWDFDWQNRYQYAEPVHLPKGTKVDARLRYDNSSANPNNPNSPPKRVRWGLQSQDEMGSITLLLVPADEEDAAMLARDIRSHRSERMRNGEGTTGMLISRIKMADEDGDGRVEKSQVPRNLQRWFDMLDQDRDGSLDMDEIDRAADLIDAMRRRRGR